MLKNLCKLLSILIIFFVFALIIPALNGGVLILYKNFVDSQNHYIRFDFRSQVIIGAVVLGIVSSGYFLIYFLSYNTKSHDFLIKWGGVLILLIVIFTSQMITFGFTLKLTTVLVELIECVCIFYMCKLYTIILKK